MQVEEEQVVQQEESVVERQVSRDDEVFRALGCRNRAERRKKVKEIKKSKEYKHFVKHMKKGV